MSERVRETGGIEKGNCEKNGVGSQWGGQRDKQAPSKFDLGSALSWLEKNPPIVFLWSELQEYSLYYIIEINFNPNFSVDGRLFHKNKETDYDKFFLISYIVVHLEVKFIETLLQQFFIFVKFI